MFAVEVLLKSFAPLHFCGYIGAYEHDDELGAKLKPGIHFLNLTDYLEEVRTNRIGTVNFQESFDDYETLVFAIGDSYTQGTGLPSDASYPFQLDLHLNMTDTRYEKKYGVVNLGLAAYGVEQEMISLNRYARLIGKPKYVLWLGCPNDVANDKMFLRGNRHRHIVDGSPYWGILLEPLQAVAYHAEIGKRLKVAVASPVQSKKMERAGHDCESNHKNVAQHLEPTLYRLVTECKELGATLLISYTHPSERGDGSYEWLRSWASERNGVRFVDWHERAKAVTSAIPALPVRNPHSGGHYRTWVNHVIAAAFRDEIATRQKAGNSTEMSRNSRSTGLGNSQEIADQPNA